MFAYLRLFFEAPPVLEAAKAKANAAIAASKVVVFSKTHCPYCTSTKTTLAQYGANATIIELNTVADGLEIQRALRDITGQRTVPNIFISGRHIGGNLDLQALESSGKLRDLLR